MYIFPIIYIKIYIFPYIYKMGKPAKDVKRSKTLDQNGIITEFFQWGFFQCSLQAGNRGH